ncbi:MAG: amidohydrolase family protein [Spirochaetota bacterium]
MGATVIKAGYALLEDGLHTETGVRVEAGRIAVVAPNDQLRVEAGDTLIDARDKLLSPGFVNGHMHMYGVLSHGISVEAAVTDFTSFLEDFWWPCMENRIDHTLVELTTRWACVEMINSGITSFLEVLEGPNSIPGALEVERKVIEGAGLRARLSFEACQRLSKENGQLGLRENAEFIRSMRAAGGAGDAKSSGGLVDGLMSIHTLFTADKDFIMQAKQLAEEMDADIHMHLSESVYEPQVVQRSYGRRPVELYEQWGFLDERVVASQAVKVSEREADILARRGCRLVHMPLSNCEVGGGVAPVPDYQRLEIPTGLGTDGYINNFFEVMRGAFLIHKAHRQNPEIMPAETVYRMATSQGAAAAGFPQTGLIQAGCEADLITIKLDTPTPINSRNVYDQLVLFRNPQDVSEVMVHGRLLKSEGKLLTMDEAAVKQELREAAARFWQMQ